MTYNDMGSIVLDLPFDTMTEVYNNGEQAILIYRPSTLSARFKDYDVNTNFEVDYTTLPRIITQEKLLFYPKTNCRYWRKYFSRLQ